MKKEWTALELASVIKRDVTEIHKALLEIVRNSQSDMARIKAAEILLSRAYGKTGVVPMTVADDDKAFAGLSKTEKLLKLRTAVAMVEKELVKEASGLMQ